MQFFIHDDKVGMRWVYTVDADSDTMLSKVLCKRGEMWIVHALSDHPFNVVVSILGRYVPEEYWEWLPER